MREKILVVDDEEEVTSLLSVALIQEGYQCQTAHSATEAMLLLRKSSENPFHLLLADIRMPVMDGIELIEQVQKQFPNVGVVATSGNNNLSLAIEAMRKGAIDFITKPFQFQIALPRIQKALERVRLERENREYQQYLEEKIDNRTAALIEKHRSLQKLFFSVVETIARAIEAKDPYTVGHSKRVANYCKHIGRKMNLDSDVIHEIEIAGLLHDVGKIGISDAILKKPTKLTLEEYESIKEHPTLSHKIVDPIQELNKVKLYMKHHHERWDGTGYPEGLRADQIPLGARILSVADAFDTMWLGRIYHEAWDFDTVIKEFQKFKGTQFDPKIVDVFMELLREEQPIFEKIRQENPPRFNEKV